MPNSINNKLGFWQLMIVSLAFITKPYMYRIKKMEGGLLLFALSYSWLTKESLVIFWLNLLLSSITYFCLYAYNDFIDRYDDLSNPKKDRAFVQQLIKHPTIFNASYTTLILVLAAISYIFFGPYKLLVFFLVILTNTLYCKLLKGVPVADILIIIICSSLFVFLATMPEYELAVTAGIMTGMPHLFQMLTDKISDAKASVKTTVVRYPHATKITTAILCFLLAFVYFIFSLPHQAIASLLPIAVTFLPFSVERQWTITRLYFTLLWVSQLYVNLY